MEIALLISLIVLNGLFAMAEIALVTARPSRLRARVEAGDRRAAAALALGEEPTKFLSTIQIGITSIGILNGIVGEAVLAGPLALWLQTFHIDREISEFAATALVVVTITYFSIVIGELLPKRIGQIAPEAIARIAARPMQWLGLLTRPFVRLLTGSTEMALELLGVREGREQQITEADIEAVLAEGSDAGVIEEHEHAMVRNVFRLDDRPIRSLMIPRADIFWLDAEEPLARSIEKLGEVGHNRFPVCAGELDNVIGIATAKLLLTQALRGEAIDLAACAETALFVPESLSGMELLEKFRESNAQLALVINEYGVIEGLVSRHNLIEAITGEFSPADADDAWAIRREDGSWLLDGLIPLEEMQSRIGLREFPGHERARYHTLSGMIMLLLDRLPRTGDVVHWAGWRFEIVDMDRKRIDKVLASRTRDTPPAAAGTPNVID